MSNPKEDYQLYGYVVARLPDIRERVSWLKFLFESRFQRMFDDNPSTNRNLIKRFAESIELAELFTSPTLIDLVRSLGVSSPVFCGPIVSHYTHSDLTGNSFGLPWHQDYPSMASSSRALIVWVSVNDCGPATHSIEVAEGGHAHGLLAGEQSDNGYILAAQEFDQTRVLDISAGDVLLFSPYLPHRTFVNPASSAYKLSFSRRFDDLLDPTWAARGFQNAYGISVDRTLYLNQLEVSSL